MRIIFDIDGTLADCRHRRHFVTDGNHDWDSFNESMVMDKPIKPIVKLHSYLENVCFMKSIIHNDGHVSLELCRSNIIFVTGRNENYRPHTIEWLNKYLLHKVEITKENLRMRPAKGDLIDHRPDWEVKEEILMQLKAEGWWPDLVVDDAEKVVQMWRKHGIICLQNSMKEIPW